MQKRDRAIKDINEFSDQEAIIKRAKTCHVAMIDGDKPYVLAFNFGYENKTIYLHTANYGGKLEILKKNNNVCVEFDVDHDLFYRDKEVACSWRWKYRSVIAHGKAEIIDDYDEKISGLKIFMKNYSDIDFKFSKPSVDNIKIIKIEIEKLSGRQFEYPTIN